MIHALCGMQSLLFPPDVPIPRRSASCNEADSRTSETCFARKNRVCFAFESFDMHLNDGFKLCDPGAWQCVAETQVNQAMAADMLSKHLAPGYREAGSCRGMQKFLC